MDSLSSGGLRDLAPALAALPLFPLPTVLFPGALLPLHIFEPRYQRMVRDALDSHRALAVVLITDEARRDANDNPQIAEVAGAGIIIDHTELPNGRLNIVLQGRARVRLEELPLPPYPYRRARATVLPSLASEATPGELSALLSAATAFAARVRERDPSFEFPFPRDAQASLLADVCAHHLVLDTKERQAILETLEVGPRVRRVAEALVLQHLTLSNDPLDLN